MPPTTPPGSPRSSKSPARWPRLNHRPKRSILFLAVTAEEKGLLGAKYYAAHPLYPLERTLADINLDVINLWGPTKDLISIGMGNSTLDDLLVEIAREHGRTVAPDADPEKGYYFRSDHFEFAKQGVPAHRSQGGPAIHRQARRFRPAKTRRIHRQGLSQGQRRGEARLGLDAAPSRTSSSWPSSGYRVAQADRYPEWKPDSEFRAKREAMLKGTKP